MNFALTEFSEVRMQDAISLSVKRRGLLTELQFLRAAEDLDTEPPGERYLLGGGNLPGVE